MAQDFNTKYTESERYRRGIDRILKSDQYTDEYKKVLMEKLGNDYNVPKESISEDVEFDLLKEGGPVITISDDSGSLININDKPAAVSGYIEKPTYLEDELTKAVDVVVDELIKAPPKQKPLTVPKEVYDDLTIQYNQSIQDLEDLREQLNAKIGELETAIADINLLNQTVDSEKLLRAAADNETQSSTERYTSVLKDFQIAMQKGIQEAIERVSLTAQVRGLQAQKEVLQQQLDNLKAITESLQGQIETQQLQLEAQQSQLSGTAAESAASAAGLTPGSDNEFYYKVTSDVTHNSAELYWVTSVDNPRGPEAGKLTIKNLRDEAVAITNLTIRISGDLLSYGPFGFADGRPPSTTKSVNIEQGVGVDVILYANKGIGGRNKPEPDRSNFRNSAKDYDGSFKILITYADGQTAETSSVSWRIRKNKH